MPSILLVDFKFNEKTHILEFGCGLNSSYTGYAYLHENQRNILYRRALEKLGEKYKHVTVLCKSPLATSQINDMLGDIKDSKATYSIQTVARYAGMGHSEFTPPEKLSTEIQKELQKNDENSCMVVMESDSYECMVYAKKMTSFLKEQGVLTHVANSHDSVAALTKNKVCCSYFGAKKYVKTELLNLTELDSKKINFVCENSEKVVIKPTNDSGGNGVIVTTPARLPLYLELIRYRKSLTSDSNIYQSCLAKCEALGIDYKNEGKALEYWIDAWNAHEDNFFLLQEFKASTPVEDYDATGRMVFIVQDDLTVDFVDGYWKLPPYKLTEKVHGSMAHVSDVHPDSDQDRPPSLSIAHETLEKIKTTVAPIIRDIVGTAIQFPLARHIEQMRKSADKDLSAYAETVLQQQMKQVLKVEVAKTAESKSVSAKEASKAPQTSPKASVVQQGIFSFSPSTEPSTEPLLLQRSKTELGN